MIVIDQVVCAVKDELSITGVFIDINNYRPCLVSETEGDYTNFYIKLVKCNVW